MQAVQAVHTLSLPLLGLGEGIGNWKAQRKKTTAAGGITKPPIDYFFIRLPSIIELSLKSVTNEEVDSLDRLATIISQQLLEQLCFPIAVFHIQMLTIDLRIQELLSILVNCNITLYRFIF
ncbi:hypothetical protein ACJX0J_017523 [Zea mays]